MPEIATSTTVTQCDGSCCVAFPLSVTYERLRDRWPWIEDAEIILDMILPLPADEVAPRRAAAGVTAPIDDEAHYACRHFDLATRKCTNYEGRPSMCRNYPYRDQECNHCGGTLDLVALAEEAVDAA